MNQLEYDKLIHSQFKKLWDIDIKLIGEDKKMLATYGSFITATDVGIKAKYDNEIEKGFLYLETKELSEDKKTLKDTILVKKTKCKVWCQGNEKEFYYINREDIVNYLNSKWKKLKNSKNYKKTESSEGVLIPVEDIEKIGGKKYKCKE